MAGVDAELPELVEAMLEPSFYPDRPRSVELRETHASWVMLAGDRAYKVKKPVTFPFLDYGTVERRREMCHEEVRLNRRLAAEIYLGVVAVASRDGRYELAAEDDPEAAEYAVEMRRVDESRSLATLAEAGSLDPAQVDAVGGVLARFHAEAPVAPPEARDVALLVEALEENLATIREAGGAEVVGAAALDAAERFTRGFLARRRDELETRAERGLVRDCHGDLRAEHVIVPESAPVYVYDCIEFNPALRRIDVATDLAFLVMDLTRLGAGQHALALVEDYRGAGGDPGGDALLAGLAAYRAWVRAKIAALRAREHGTEADGRADEDEARELFRLGRRFAWRARRPLALVVSGVAGSGKTTLARELAELSGWEHLSSDLVRKRAAGLDPAERGDPMLYGPEQRLRTYRELGSAAREELGTTGGVIVDATFHLRAEREAFREGLGDPGAALLHVECEAPRETLLARVRERAHDPGRVSDAGVEVAERQLAEREPLTEVPEPERTALDTTAAPAELAAAVESFVDRAGRSH